MNYQEYINRLDRLREVLKDAIDRGDYNLEFDAKELIDELNETFKGDE